MGIFEELKISLLKPQFYNKFKDESMTKLLKFSLIITLLGSIYILLTQMFFALLSKSLPSFFKLYSILTFSQIISTLIYLWIGLIVTALFYSLIFLVYLKFKKIEAVRFKTLFNYAAHCLTPSIVLGVFFGPFVILFALGYFIMAVNGEKYLTNTSAKKNKIKN